MSIRLEKPWLPLVPDTVRALPGQLGVYQIADAEGRILYIGYAGGRSRFGLRGELEAQCVRRTRDGDRGARFRVEVHMAYLTRYQELLMIHRADHGALPPENDLPRRLGRLHPR